MKARGIVYGALVVVFAGLLGLAWPDLVGRVAYAVEGGQAAAAKEQLKTARDLSQAFQDVARAVRPSVVNVRSVQRIEIQRTPTLIPFFERFPGDDRFGRGFLERFFGGREQAPERPQEFVRRGVGTGVIVSRDGYIVTNNHVVRDASSITVTLSDNRSFDAKIVGTDEKTDLAVLKINASDLYPADLGDSDSLSVGEWVLAVGNPFGLTHTVTAGIISATGRANVGIADYEDFIQTDAAINPGNSGGPLVSLDGKVIGINTAIATRTGTYEGIGFAIPSNMVRQVVDAIVKEGKVVRGWLGVAIQNLTDDLAASFRFEGREGVLVGDVTPGGPAERAGVRPEDIIVRYNGRKVSDVNQLRNLVAATRPGEKVELEVFRDGRGQTLRVEVGELASGQAMAANVGAEPSDLGLTVETLTPQVAEALNLRRAERGALVTHVQPESPAERCGLARGDVIIAVGDEPIEDAGELRKALSEADLNAGVRLRVLTDGMQRFVILKR